MSRFLAATGNHGRLIGIVAIMFHAVAICLFVFRAIPTVNRKSLFEGAHMPLHHHVAKPVAECVSQKERASRVKDQSQLSAMTNENPIRAVSIGAAE
jgi:hypothetical protein